MIRPDLVLTEEGYTIAEIDSVPGGIGLTAWLNQTYSAFDAEIIGGADGMLDGFQSVLPKGGDIVIAEESATYRPEMEWIVARLKDRPAVAGVADPGSKARSTRAGVSDPGNSWRVVSAENYEPQLGATFTGSSSCLMCRTFPTSTTRCAQALKAASRLRRRSSHISKRKCGSRFFGCSRCANSGDASLAKNIFCNFRKSFPT